MWQRFLFIVLFVVGLGLSSMPHFSFPQRSLNTLNSAEWLKRCSSEINSRILSKRPQEIIPWREGNEYLSTSWAYGLNLTGIAMAANSPRGVAVTPRHLLYTKHYGWHAWPTQTVNFLTNDNQVISRVVEQVKYLGTSQTNSFAIDVAVVRLAEDLPESISPMKLVAPLGLKEVGQKACPILRIDKENKGLLVAIDNSSESYFATFFHFLHPTIDSSLTSVRPYAPFYEPMIPGDSTSPSILVYRDASGVTPFLISQVTAADLGDGPNLSALAGDIQAAIKSFGDTDSKYRLQFGPSDFIQNSPLPPNPTCKLDVIYRKRTSVTGTCSFRLEITNDSFMAVNPLLTPRTPNWKFSPNKKTATGTLPCNGSDFDRNYLATVKGPSGHGNCSATVR